MCQNARILKMQEKLISQSLSWLSEVIHISAVLSTVSLYGHLLPLLQVLHKNCTTEKRLSIQLILSQEILRLIIEAATWNKKSRRITDLQGESIMECNC